MLPCCNLNGGLWSEQRGTRSTAASTRQDDSVSNVTHTRYTATRATQDVTHVQGCTESQAGNAMRIDSIKGSGVNITVKRLSDDRVSVFLKQDFDLASLLYVTVSSYRKSVSGGK